MKPSYEELEARCAALAAEKEKFAVECAATKIAIAYLKSGRHDFTLNTPATDAFLAEVRAQGLNAFIQHRSAELDAHIKNGGEQFDEKSVRIRDIIVSARLFREQIRKGGRPMSNIDKQALNQEKIEWLNKLADMEYCKSNPGHWLMSLKDTNMLAKLALRSVALLDEIAELEQRHCGTALLEREEMHTKTLGRMLDELEESERLRLKFQEANCELCQKLEAAEKRIAELEAREVKLPNPHAHLIWIQAGHAPDDYWDDVAVSHSEKDKCCDGSDRYPVYALWEIKEALSAIGINIAAAGKGE